MQPISHEIWDSKYRLKDANGNSIDRTLDDTFERVAGALANVEEKPDEWYEPFLWALKNGAVPAGRIMSNAGAQDHKPGTSLINCIVSDTIPDSMEGILAKLAEAGLSLKAGCGIGYEFSTLRPKGAKVMGPGAYTSGPLPFMDVFDALCTTVSSAGGRRGAQMATFDASHPDVLDFIRAKRQDGRLRQFNLSLLVSDRLMNAVKAGAEWPLVFPGREEVYPAIQAGALWDEIMRSTYEYAEPGVLFIDRINQYNNLWWCEDIRATNPCCAEGTLVATPAGYRRVETLRMDDEICTAYGGIGRVEAVEVHEDMPVYEVTLDNGISIEVTLSHIFHSRFNHHIGRGWSQEHRLCDLRMGDLLRVVDEGVDRGVPIVGIKYSRNTRVFDLYEPTTDTWVTEGGVVSRGCGEQPLSSYGACLLGSVDLTKFVRNPLSPGVQFDWNAYRKVINIFTRMLDNVVEIANLPLPEQREELRRKRRHGMGVLGLGSAMAMLGIRYGSSESCSFTGTVMRVMAEVGWEQAVQLAREKGPAPIMGELFEIDGGVLGGRRGLRDFLGGGICGSTLFARGSLYMHKLSEVYPTIVEDLAYHGARFTHHTSIAPTGTIALAFANNASNGIEPSFAHQYTRNLTKQGRKTREAVEVYSVEALLWQEKYGNEPYPDYFVTAEQVSPKEHIDVQAAAQQWVDSSISKTINCPTGMSFEEFKEVYQYAYEKGLKGCATFRFNPEFQQGILVTAENLANTQYCFRLDDGTLIEARGDDVLEYEGESHSVANLYDALKEGQYGRY